MLSVDKNPVVVAWVERGLDLSKREKEHRWALGDWLADGDEKWGGRAYDEAQRIFPDLSRKYLQQTAYVARSVKLPFRKEELSFAHHEVVAPLEPTAQVRWLAEALKPPKMSVKALRAAIAAERPPENAFNLALPWDTVQKLEDLARACGQSAAVLIITAVNGLLERSAEQVLAQQQRDQAAVDVRHETDRIREIARSKAQDEWTRKVKTDREAYVRANPSPVLDIKALGSASDSLSRKIDAIRERLKIVQGDDLRQRLENLMDQRVAERDKIELMRDAAKEEHQVAYDNWRRDIERRFPWTAAGPDRAYRAQIAAQVAKELADEAAKIAEVTAAAV